MSATNHAVAKLAVPARSPFPFLETFIFGIAQMEKHVNGNNQKPVILESFTQHLSECAMRREHRRPRSVGSVRLGVSSFVDSVL